MENNEGKETSKVIEDYGSIAVDLGKLIFGSLVLGSVIRGSFSEKLLLMVGLASSVLFIVGGIWLKNKNKSKPKRGNVWT